MIVGVYRLALAGLLAAWVAAPAAFAKLEFETTTQTVPAKWSDKEVIGVFKFKNTGKETVKITEMQSNCRCTTPKLAKMEYAPGESGELQAVFAVDERTGPQHKVITVKTNLPDQPSIELSFNTDVPVIPGLSPQLLTWVLGHKPETKTVTITVPPDMAVERVEAVPDSLLVVASLKALGPGKGYELSVTPTATPEKTARIELPVVIHSKDGVARRRIVTLMFL